MQPKYKNISLIVIYKKQGKLIKYLILKRKLQGKYWELPTESTDNPNNPQNPNNQEEKISILKIIKNEIKRQTGQVPYYIKKYSTQGKYKYENLTPNQEIIGDKYKLYSAEIKDSNIILDPSTHLDYKLLDYKKAIEYLTIKEQRQALTIANEKLLTIFHLKPKPIKKPRPKPKPKPKQGKKKRR